MTTTTWHSIAVADDAFAVLDFWFGESSNLDDIDVVKALNNKWFMGGSAFDDEIKSRFSELTNAALKNKLDVWNETIAGQLAHILVLDQFPRNLFRSSPDAFAGDTKAMELAKSAIATAEIDQLHPHEQVFVAMPYQHSEQLLDQEASLNVFGDLRNKAPVGHEDEFENTFKYARLHHEIIEQFGRFPHRNSILSRSSTDAEETYLANDAPRFGQ